MDIKIGVGRRIVIPKELFDTTEFKEGDVLDIVYHEGKFILSNKNQANSSLVENKKEKVQVLDKPGQNVCKTKTREIKSNLEEGKKLSRQIYSPCGLVIRTKRRYINEFCDDCKGKLLEIEGKDNGECMYSTYHNKPDKQINTVSSNKNSTNISCTQPNKKSVKTESRTNEKTKLIHEIVENAKKVENKINEQISNLESDDTFVELGKITIQPVKIKNGYKKCTQCSELRKSGFMLDKNFMCKECTMKDFKEYYKIYKERGNRKCLNQ